MALPADLSKNQKGFSVFVKWGKIFGMNPTFSSAHTGPSTDTVVNFQWGIVPNADREWLKRRTEDLTTLTYRVGCDYTRLGVLLCEVRSRIKKGLFVRWLDANTPFSRRHAYRLMCVGKAFGQYITLIERIEPYALYVLADPRVKPAIRDHAVQLASEGKTVTRALAVEIIDAHKDVHLSIKEVKSHFGRMRAVAVPKMREKTKLALEEATRDEQAKRWGWLLKLIETFDVVNISRNEDIGGDTEGEPTYSVICRDAKGRTSAGSGRDPHMAVAHAAGVFLTKWCPSCRNGRGADVPVEKFSRNRTRPDGLHDNCRPCELRRQEKRNAVKENVKPPVDTLDTAPTVLTPAPSEQHLA